jgi:hypothetical protein
MTIETKKDILTELYKSGRLKCAQIVDLVDNSNAQDIIVFEYDCNPGTDCPIIILLDYVYGANFYNSKYKYRKALDLPANKDFYLEAILDNAYRVYKALVDRNLI